MSRTARNEPEYEKNTRLWEDSEDPGALLLANWPLVRGAARKHATVMGRMHLYEDYLQAAAEGFLRAFESRNFDPSKGTVGTFTGMWMKHVMQATVDKNSGWTGFSATHAVTQGIQPYADMPSVVSIEKPVTPKPHDKRVMGDLIADPHDGTEAFIESFALAQDLDALRALLPKQKQRAWFDDWLACERPDKPIQELKVLWDVKEPTVANRLGEIKIILRNAKPDAITGSVKVGRWSRYDHEILYVAD